MARKRIPTKPTELRDQLVQSLSGIGGETNWPLTAPQQIDVDVVKSQLDSHRLTLSSRNWLRHGPPFATSAMQASIP